MKTGLGLGIPSTGGLAPLVDDLTSLAFRLTGSTITQAANRVSAWGDTYVLSEGGGANQPLYTASNALLNNKPSVTFDNLDTRLRASGATSIWHLFIVGYYPATTFGGVRLLWQRNPGGAFNHMFRSQADATWRVSDPIAGTHYRNGVATATALGAANVPQVWEFQCTASESGAWHMGDDVSLSGRQFVGTVAEVRAYSTLKSGANLAGIRAQLASDYGITL